METLQHIFQIPFACGCFFLLAAAAMHLIPPKKINYLYGYRTPASMASPERWEFAQTYSTRQMVKGALVMMLFSLVGIAFPDTEALHVTIGIVLLLACAAYIFIATERGIKKRFPAS